MLDPDFPQRGKTNIGKSLDWTRWLDRANGGSFEWGTAAEEKARGKSKARTQIVSDPAASGASPPQGSATADSCAALPFQARLRSVIDQLSWRDAEIPPT